MKFSIRKLLIITAVYAASLALLVRLGAAGIVVAVILGTAISGIILLAKREAIGSIVRAAIFTTVGTIFGIELFTPTILWKLYFYDHGHGETAHSMFISGTIGALIGAVLACFLKDRKTPPNDLQS